MQLSTRRRSGKGMSRGTRALDGFVLFRSPLVLVGPPRGRDRSALNVPSVTPFERFSLGRHARTLSGCGPACCYRTLLTKSDRLDGGTNLRDDDVRFGRVVWGSPGLVVLRDTRGDQTRIFVFF